MRKGMKAKPAYLEIGQYWIDPKGHATVVNRFWYFWYSNFASTKIVPQI